MCENIRYCHVLWDVYFSCFTNPVVCFWILLTAFSAGPLEAEEQGNSIEKYHVRRTNSGPVSKWDLSISDSSWLFSARS